MQALLRDAHDGEFEVILAESLDRLSRDQEDIAGIYKRLRFAGIELITLSEGLINDLHIGLKGTMNALFLKDLADKTRRGLRGRVEAGKSGGGNSYGYDVVRAVSKDGEPIKGERGINNYQAGIITRIFNEYAEGISPRAIAKILNAEHIPGPTGKAWGPSTIHGNRQRGTGILNNELYIGKLVWNRLRYLKDPDTGKRVSRLNPESDWIIKDVPAMRIVEQQLWEKVKARQGTLKATKTGKGNPGYWDRRRPRYLFSGLMGCGTCGGGIIHVNAERIGCASARNKGTCDNLRTLRRDELEATVLDGLQNHLMDPSLTKLFCTEYTKEMNKLRSTHNAGLKSAQVELEKVTREIDRLIQAILDGVPGTQVKDKIASLEDRKTELSHSIEKTDEQPILFHPNMATHYQSKITQLIAALTDNPQSSEAAEVLRQLIDKIILSPVDHDGKKTLSLTIHDDLAGILSMATKSKKPLEESGLPIESAKLVAGAGFTQGPTNQTIMMNV